MEMMSEFDNKDVTIGNEIFNPIERELDNTIEGSANHYDAESNSLPMRNSSHENEFRVFNVIPS